MRRMITLIALALVASMALAGCGNKGLSESDLKNILPDNITNCYFNDDLRHQTVESINIIKSDITDDTQFVQCEITLSDAALERCVYANLNARKYEVGGWIVDSWSLYQKDHVTRVDEPDNAYVDAFMNELGYSQLSEVESHTDYADFVTHERTYEVNDPHTYVTFSGKVKCVMELIEYEATDEYPARFSWEGQYARSPEVDYSELSCAWNIPTHLSGVEVNPTYNLPHRFDASLEALVEDADIVGSGAFQYPAYDGFEPKGEYGSYNFAKAQYQTEGGSPSDATTTLILTYSYGPPVVLTFTPDEVSVTKDSLNGTMHFDLDEA